MESIKFRSIGEVIGYYLRCNPARARTYNIFEPDKSKRRPGKSLNEKPNGEIEFGDHPEDMYAAVTLALKRAKNLYKDDRAWKGFELLMLQKEDSQGNTFLSVEEVAQKYGIPTSTFYRHLKEISDTIRGNLARLGYMQKDETKEVA